MGFNLFGSSKSSSTSNYTTNYNTTYGSNSGANIDSVFGNKQISAQGFLSNEVSDGGFSVGGVQADTSNRSDNTNTTSQKDEFGISAAASVGVGGNSGNAGSGSVGGGSSSIAATTGGGGYATTGEINPLYVLAAGAAAIIVIGLTKKKG